MIQTINLQNKKFKSYHTFELIHDSGDQERHDLAVRKMYRTVAPWVTENPIMHHMKIAQPDAVRRAIDQAAHGVLDLLDLLQRRRLRQQVFVGLAAHIAGVRRQRRRQAR